MSVDVATIKEQSHLQPPNEERPLSEVVYDEILVHLKCLNIAPQKDYAKCITRIVDALPSTLVSLKHFDFGSMLEYVDDQGLSISHFTDRVEFMHLPGSVLKKSLTDVYGNVIADCTSYMQLLSLAYCYKNCTDKSLCLINASYMIGVVELYQSIISAPLRAKIIYYINLINDQYNATNSDYLAFLHRHLRYSHSAGDSACVGQVLVLICRFYARKKEFTSLYQFVCTPLAIEAVDCFNHVTFYNPNKVYLYSRYSHYCGLLYMVLCRYDAAFSHLSEALRAAPLNRASGFKSLTAKYLILVQLLHYNNAHTDYNQHLKEGASAYCLLEKTISYGNMDVFSKFVKLFQDVYIKDGLMNIVKRLPLAVGNRAIKTILNSYSSISIKQIATKLLMDNDEDAQNAIAAYIRVNNMEGIRIDCSEGVVYNSHHLADYGTYHAFEQLHKRILAGAANSDTCIKKMLYDTKDYYNKLAHDSEDKLFIDDDSNAGGGNMMWMSKDDHDDGPDAGI